MILGNWVHVLTVSDSARLFLTEYFEDVCAAFFRTNLEVKMWISTTMSSRHLQWRTTMEMGRPTRWRRIRIPRRRRTAMLLTTTTYPATDIMADASSSTSATSLGFVQDFVSFSHNVNIGMSYLLIQCLFLPLIGWNKCFPWLSFDNTGFVIIVFRFLSSVMIEIGVDYYFLDQVVIFVYHSTTYVCELFTHAFSSNATWSVQTEMLTCVQYQYVCTGWVLLYCLGTKIVLISQNNAEHSAILTWFLECNKFYSYV